MTDTTERHAVTQVTWCMTRNGYADESVGCPTATDHDHYDLVLDDEGKTLFRVWPVGTTWRTPEGHTYRLRGYEKAFGDLMHAYDIVAEPDLSTVPSRPTFDAVSPGGGAFVDSEWLPGPDDVIVEYVLAEGVRPAPSAVFLRPNGEVWRLRDYRLDMASVGEDGENIYLPSWQVMLVARGFTNRDTLPDDARLVWHP